MKKLLLALTLVFTLTGCGEEAKINDYVSQADDYRKEGKLTDAIDLYSKALDLKEAKKIREKLNSTKQEKDNVEVVKGFLKVFSEVDRYYMNHENMSATKVQEATDQLREAMDKLEEINDTPNTDIAKFTREIKGDMSGYNVVESYVENSVADNGEQMDDLAVMSEDFQRINEAENGLFNMVGRYIKDISEMEIPEKYERND